MESHSIRRIRMRLVSTTEKWPCQSAREFSTSSIRFERERGFVPVILKSMIPEADEIPRRNASSPKSLSKVKRILDSTEAIWMTCSSVIPGDVSRIHEMSCPPSRRLLTEMPGKFSSARSLNGRFLYVGVAKTRSSEMTLVA